VTIIIEYYSKKDVSLLW